jgi:hypothetical protein
MIHLGNIPASTTVYVPFTTYGGTSGQSITCSGLAVTDIEIYKNGSTTQRASDAGLSLLDTDGIDFDGITGLHGFSIDLSDNTDASFYAVGSWYWVVVSAITVDSQTVTFLAATFRIAPAESVTGTPKVDVVAISGDSTAADNLETACDGGSYNLGGGGVVAASVTGAVALPTIPTDWITADGVAASAISEIQSGLSTLTASGVRTAIGMASANLDTQLGLLATDSDLGGLITTVGVAGAGLTAIPWNASWDAEVQSECTDALNAYDPPTKTEQDTAFTEIKGAGWSSTTDTLEKIRDASGGGGGGSTVVVNPIALFAPGSTNDVMEIHQHETSSRGFLFYDVAANGARTAKDFDSFANLRWAFDLPDGTVWIETADITVADNLLTIPLADLSSDVGQFDATLWDWAGEQPEDERTVVLCSQLLVNEAVGAGDVVTA